MTPPIFATCKADSGVTALIGSNPCRLYPFGEAPQGVAKPYVVWQVISGLPENYLAQVPDIDSFSIQIDVYADTASSARATAEAIRDAIEPNAYVTSYNGEGRDSETRNYRYGFSVDWIVQR